MSIFQVTAAGNSVEELKNNLTTILTQLGAGKAAKSDDDASAKVARSIAKGDATVSSPKKGAKATEPEPEDDGEADAEDGEAEGEDEADPLGEDVEDEAEAVTLEDVRTILLEVREVDNAKMMDLLNKAGAKALKDLKQDKYQSVVDAAKKYLATKKKSGKK